MVVIVMHGVVAGVCCQTDKYKTKCLNNRNKKATQMGGSPV